MNGRITKNRILKHLLFWIIYLIVSAGTKAITQNHILSLPFLGNYLTQHIFYLSTDIIATYFTVYYLFPKFLFRGQYLKFALFMVLSIAFFVHLYRGIVFFYEIPKNYPDALAHTSFFQFDYLQYFAYCYIVVGIMAFIKLVDKWILTQKERNKLKNENATSQLQLLRSQLSPHFLFNTLNNIDSLIFKEPEKASSSVIKLSEIMRYMLYEAKNDRVLLEDEINYIKNIVELQRIRMVNPGELSLILKGNANGHMIAPMMFVPFIENLFKHGISSKSSPSFQIEITINESSVHFRCSNHTKPGNNRSESQGIGLANVTKRLNLIYPDTHMLEMTHKDDLFTVNLTLPL